MKKVLIAYASRTGTTVEIAEAIGKTLGERGFAVDVRPIQEKPSVERYQAVLIGSAIIGGNFLPEAAEFVRANGEALRKTPVALFVVHFFFRGNGETDRKTRESYLNEIRPLVPQASEVFFAGRFSRRTVTVGGVPEWMARLTPTIDRRDWGKIRAWAEKLDL
jgi:menaquinone-dependent protoporphyrinogen oxidase